MIYAIIGLSFLFVILAFILTEGNAKHLLSGYNTLSKEEQEKVDISRFIPFYRNFHLFLGASLLVLGFVILHFIGEIAGGLLLSIYPILAYIYFILKSPSYSHGLPQKGNKIAIGVLLGTLLLVLGLFYLGYQEDHLIIGEGKITLTGNYGEELSKSEVKAIELIKNLPKIKSKTNGFSIGNIRKGYFKTANNEKIKLVLNNNSKPLILITKSTGDKIYFAARSKSNKEIYEHLNKLFPE